MNNGLKALLIGSALLSLPVQAAPTKTAQKNLQETTTLERIKAAVPAFAKVALFGTASSIALDYSLKNFEVLISEPSKSYSPAFSQIRKLCYSSFGPIVAAMVYELVAKESPEADEYRKEPVAVKAKK